MNHIFFCSVFIIHPSIFLCLLKYYLFNEMLIKNSEMFWSADDDRIKHMFVNLNSYKLATIYYYLDSFECSCISPIKMRHTHAYM